MPLVPNPPLAPKITRIYVPANTELQARYEDTLMPLVYGSSAPSYVQAFSLFEDVALDFLSSCEAGEAVRVT